MKWEEIGKLNIYCDKLRLIYVKDSYNKSSRKLQIKISLIIILIILLIGIFPSLNLVTAESGGRIFGLNAVEIYGILLQYVSGDEYFGTTQGHDIVFNTRNFIIRDITTGDEKRVSKLDILYPEESVNPIRRYNYGNSAPMTISSMDWNNEGKSLINLGNYEDAANAFKNALIINPYYGECWNNLGVAFYRLENYEEAINSYNLALSINPTDVKAWYNKGIALDKQTKYADAIISFDNAISINPEYTKAWCEKASTLSNLGRYEDAIEVCYQALLINEENSKTWNNLGFAFNELGKYQDAIDAYDMALQIDPNNMEIVNNLDIARKNHDSILGNYQTNIEIPDQQQFIDNTQSDYYNGGISISTPNSINLNKDICFNNQFNCPDFQCQEEAQRVYDYCFSETGEDIHKLDGNPKDGIACNNNVRCYS